MMMKRVGKQAMSKKLFTEMEMDRLGFLRDYIKTLDAKLDDGVDWYDILSITDAISHCKIIAGEITLSAIERQGQANEDREAN